MSKQDQPWDVAIKVARSRFASIGDVELAAFIEAQPDVKGPVKIESLEILTDGSGMSNGIGFFTARIDRGDGPRLYDLVLRYAPGVSLIKQKSFADEFETMRVVRAAGLPVPEAMWLDPDGSTLGAAGFVMGRVEGDAPATAMYSRGPFAKVSPEVRHAMMLEPAAIHGRLRKAGLDASAVPHLADRGEGESAFERELNWWLREAELISTPEDPRYLRIREVRDWLLENRPELRPATLVHGDAQHCNTIFRDGKPAAVLDWELAHLGYAETDIVMMVLTTEILKRTDAPAEGTPTEADYIARYETESGHKVEHWEFFKVVMTYRYLVGQFFAASVMPNPEEMWRMTDDLVRQYQAEASAVRQKEFS